jgi:ribosomal protein S18 acetylase RimI-like enzyme
MSAAEITTYQITRFNQPNQKWLEAVLELRAGFSDNPQLVDDGEPFASYISRRLSDENMLLALAWDGETAVGYGLAFDVAEHPYMPEWTRAGYITQFMVRPEYRQRGVGAQLMDYLDAWFAARGLTKVLLNVDIDNPTGQRFWQKHGFKPYATRMKRGQ